MSPLTLNSSGCADICRHLQTWNVAFSTNSVHTVQWFSGCFCCKNVEKFGRDSCCQLRKSTRPSPHRDTSRKSDSGQKAPRSRFGELEAPYYTLSHLLKATKKDCKYFDNTSKEERYYVSNLSAITLFVIKIWVFLYFNLLSILRHKNNLTSSVGSELGGSWDFNLISETVKHLNMFPLNTYSH